jgi:hypothetical protein
MGNLLSLHYQITKKLTEMKKETATIRAELTENYCFVRSLEQKGGVIDAIVKSDKINAVKAVIEKSDGKTFSEVWQEMIQIKGVRFEYQSY